MPTGWAALAFFCVFALAAPGVLGLDTTKRLAVTRAMLAGEGFTAGTEGRIRWTRDGKPVTYEVYGLGQSLLMMPLEVCLVRPVRALAPPPLRERAGTMSLGLTLFPLCGAAAAVAFVALLARLGFAPRTALAWGALLATATPWLAYGGDPQETSQVTLLLVGGVLAVMKGCGGQTPGNPESTETRPGGAGWVFFGVAAFWVTTVFRPNLALDAALFSGWAAWTARGSLRRTVLIAAACNSLFAVAWFCAYNTLRFGSPLPDAYTRFFRQEGVAPWSHPFWEGLTGPLLSPDRGLLWLCPLLVPAAWATMRKPSAAGTLALTAWFAFAAGAAVLAKYVFWGGNASLGPRLQMHLLPFLLLPLAHLLRRPTPRRWLVALVVFSVVIQLGQRALSPQLEWQMRSRGNEVSFELTAHDGPGALVERWKHLAWKVDGSLEARWLAGKGAPLSSYQRSLVEWDVFWGRAWNSGRSAGTAATVLALALLALGTWAGTRAWRFAGERPEHNPR